ncbi:bifunctional adenosylcobinamide kinase/adenosylcobinamide-phosphate guanylyltransferase [Bacillus rubiinfantis]|uniref:bifunctional adenosylcobinamide kinase/adenosylcobinamide-phosphate guanylyltransferase n=1 Tax=Bacillus rubiinfantis TaxID=1499680 RepID=UPI0005A709AF|nr:bifunctional adenosylcobinamide kinase/adenosylcobinamide-phosphate guanylyltransferase [Bacillus rubiinfantis]
MLGSYHDASLIFISGGVRSGKSSFAEKLTVKLARETGGKLNYIAAGVAFDAEMTMRIKKHQQDRAVSGYHWKTFEQPIDVGVLAPSFHREDIVLLDCLTTLVNNELFAVPQPWDEEFLQKLISRIIAGVFVLKQRARALIVVSNEVLNEPVASNDLVFTYGKILGHIHQQIVKAADLAFLVEAGVPLVMKNRLNDN